MTADPEFDLPSFEQAKLRSERVRILCMMGLFAAFVLLGVFRILVPHEGETATGWIVLGLAAAYLGEEALLFHLVSRALNAQRAVDSRLGIGHAMIECSFPIVGIYLLTLLNPDDRYTFLVSPGYAFLLILVAVSVLRVDWQATALTGVVAALGYGGLAALALNRRDSATVNPHPAALYVNLTLMLGLATLAAVFVTLQVHGYVVAAVREMEIRKQRDRLKHDLEIAREIQQRLLPRVLPDYAGYQFAAVSRPADETGGDYYDWQEISPRRAVFSLGDVTGHGIGPALVTAASRAYVRAILSNQPAPKAVLERVNSLLHADLTEGRFVTLALVDLNTETHEVRLLSAGHGPTLHVRGSDGAVNEIGSQGLPLGLYEDGMLEEPVQFQLEPGDLVVLCSDGFFEPANACGEEFGLARLTEVLRTNRSESATRLVSLMENAVRQFIGSASQPDDITALIMKREP